MRQAITILLAMSTMAATAAAAPDAKISYSYPEQARAIPQLREWLDMQAAAVRAETTSEAAADHVDADKTGRPFNPYEADRTWKVVTDTPRFLSLSLERYDYTGGAHGNPGYAGLVWDRQTAARLTPLSFFTSAEALKAAIQAPFCHQIDVERRQKRGADAGTGYAGFNDCLDPTQQTLLLGSSTHQRFDRIGILVAPYSAGPYAEGTYEVTLPVTPAVLAAVKPEWRPYFAASGTP